MNPATLGLLFWGVFLQEAAASDRARCSEGLCCFQRSLDFKAAQEICEGSYGELVQTPSGHQVEELKRLLGEFGGRFWLQGGPNCTSVSVTSGSKVTVLPEPCNSTLDGFLCLYQSSFCGAVQSSGGTSVTYRTKEDFHVRDSDSFPPGTVALVKRPDAQYPLSKHLCYSVWLPAPWNCEVLQGGCDHGCENTACTCPDAHPLHHNNISCVQPPATSPPLGVQACEMGYRLAADGSCVDVDECAEEADVCTAEGELCVNLDGSHKCECADDFEMEEGACVNVSICDFCEHMDCRKVGGVYGCACKKGFRVSPKDPTRCEQVCDRRECPALCERDMRHCRCPEGYILDKSETKATCYDIDECEAQKLCDHRCENLPGGFRCVCGEGYTLQAETKCVRLQAGGDEDGEDGSGSPPPPPLPVAPSSLTPSGLQPAALPSYVKTGSVLGITVFLVLCAGLLGCVIKRSMGRCGTLTLNSLKHSDIDIFYLQQVTTDNYKRLSFDKQLKSDSKEGEGPPAAMHRSGGF